MHWPSLSLRRLLVGSLLGFAVVPAALVGWQMYSAQVITAREFSQKTVSDVAQRVQADTEIHLGEAHTIFNGILYETPSEAQLKSARLLLADLRHFETLAFTLTRMSTNMPYLYVGKANGEFLGVENISKNTGNYLRVGVRGPADQGRSYYLAFSPGDRSQPQSTESKNFEPRSRPWYQAAMEAKGRAFSAIYPSASKKQLLITLAQPIYGVDGGALGVMAVEVYLKRLSELLQLQKISALGVAYLVDEQGLLVASSTGDALYTETGDKLLRVKPDTSNNPTMRESFSALQGLVGKTQAESVQRISADRQVQGADGQTLIASMRPFGESLGLRWTLIVAAPETDFSSGADKSLQRSLLILTGVIALGALLAGLFAYRLNRRFAQLNLAAEQLGRGEVPPLPGTSHVTEISALARVLHDSGQWLQASRAETQAKSQELLDANEHLEARVASRTAELEASRQAAESATRAKASFLATMSHEIRTPLNGVVGMTTLLADTPLNSEQSDYVHTMRVSSDQLLGVINDILDFSKIESGKLDLESEPLNLQATIEEACDIAAPRAREKGLELLADMGDHVPTWVRGDVTRLRQVLLNFINNAIKFTEHGQIVVSANLLRDFAPGSPALLEFRVKDTGIGIPLERQSALFQSFTQVDASTTRKYGGTGLGLAICKRLAEIMGGQVGLESALGEGASFWFTAQLDFADAPDHSQSTLFEMASLNGKLALVVDDTSLNLRILDKQLKRWGMHTVLFERAQPALDWLADHTVDVVVTDMHMPEMDGQTFAETLRTRSPDMHVVLLTSGTMPTGEAAKVFDARLLKPYRQTQLFDALTRVTAALPATKKSALEPAVSFKNQRILVADDNAVNLKVALAMLGKLGYEAATAHHGREAVDLVAQSLRPQGTPFAAILMDVNMPVMDGLAAARLILSIHGSAAPPMVALTASVLEEDRQRCLAAGMVGFLPKPLRIDELSEALARYAVVMQDAPKIIAARAIPEKAAASNFIKNQVILMDWSRLEQFKEFDDDARSMTREVIALFTADAPLRVGDIQQAYQASDSAALSRAAHALKGAASNVGASALGDACFALEQSCQYSQWPHDAASQVAAVVALADTTCQALHDWAA